MLEKTTLHFQAAIEIASQLAAEMHDIHVTTEHILMALLTRRNIATVLLERLNLNLDNVRTRIIMLPSFKSKIMDTGVADPLQTRHVPLLSVSSQNVILLAYDEANCQGSQATDEGHLLLALIRSKEVPARQILTDLGIDLEQLRYAQRALCEGDEQVFSKNTENSLLQGNLHHILIALQNEKATIREEAIQHLHAYVISASSEMENGTLTQVAIEEWDKMLTLQLQFCGIVKLLLAAMEDTSARIRAFTALVLGHVTIVEAEESLIRHIQNDPAYQVRRMCVNALGHRPNSPYKRNGLIAALKDIHFQVVSFACKSLGETGDLQAVKPLYTVLSHSSWNVRFRACEALVRLKAVDLQVANLIEELSQQPEAQQHNEMVRKACELYTHFNQEAKYIRAQAQTTRLVLDEALRQINS